MYSTKLLLSNLDVSEPGEGQGPRGHLTCCYYSTLNKAPLYLVCVPNKVKGELSDVNIQFFVC